METGRCRLDFLPDGAVSVSCCGSELMMYGSDPETGSASVSCSVGYASDEYAEEGGNKRVTALDIADRIDIVENVRFTVRRDGSITSGIIK